MGCLRHSDRVALRVAASGAAEAGQWVTLKREVVQDFVRAIGEPPGKWLPPGVQTDTDNAAENVEAWYGDIRFEPS